MQHNLTALDFLCEENGLMPLKHTPQNALPWDILAWKMRHHSLRPWKALRDFFFFFFRKVWWPDATHFYFIGLSFHTYNTFTHSYIHEHSPRLLSVPSSLNSSVADISLGCRVGTKCRDSDSGPPYSEPTCFQLSHAVPDTKYAPGKP
jgi:hypothetical protein